MKVFEVTTETQDISDPSKMMLVVQYVTTESDHMIDVILYFMSHCLSLNETLKSVREVCEISQHIKV